MQKSKLKPGNKSIGFIRIVKSFHERNENVE